jgi:Domain of unknown function (DUF4350)
MPAGLSPGDRRLFLAAGVILALMVGVSAVLTEGSGNVVELPSSYSVASGGAKAAFRLLTESGYRAERWEQSLTELPSGAGATLILAEPESAPTREEHAAVLRFVEQGGTLITTGMSGSLFLPERHVSADPVAGLTWEKMSAQAPTAITRAAPEITLAPRAYWDSEVFAIPLYGSSDRERVIEYPYRAGRVMWWASATPLTNAGIREPGNLEFVLASVGGSDRRVLWDESFHGYRRSSSAPIGWRPLAALGAQALIFAAAVVLTYSRRSGPLVPSVVERRLSPLEFVRTLGSLYQRAGATSVAVDAAYQRFTFALTRRLGLAGTASPEELERAVRDRWKVDADFGDVLRACDRARTDPGLSAADALKLTRALNDYTAALSLFGPPGKEIPQ